jgi:diguanylate cyclase (GGDEF)-like protein
MGRGKGTDNHARRRCRLYLLASMVLIVAYPLLPGPLRTVAHLATSVGAAGVVLLGLHQMPATSRRPWMLLFVALLAINVGELLRLGGAGAATAISGVVDAFGNLLILAAALTLIARRGRNDLGGLIDTSIIALAAGGLLWDLVLLPQLLATGATLATRVNTFVVVFALVGVLGPLLRLTQDRGGAPIPALWLLLSGLTLGIGGTILMAVTTDPGLAVVGQLMFMGVYTLVGLAAIAPSAASLSRPAAAEQPDRLSAGRLTFLGLAVALIPVVTGVRALFGNTTYGLMLAVNAVLVTALVMVRISLLSAERARAEQALRYEAAHDPLTRLPNKREFMARLAGELARGGDHAILFCDLNDFKPVNDRLGHSAGDLILVEVAHRIRACLSDTDVVSRFGGDEFLILLNDIRMTDIDPTVRRISDAIASPIPVGDIHVRVGASIGVAGTSAEADPEELIQQADHAMYRAKREGQQ